MLASCGLHIVGCKLWLAHCLLLLGVLACCRCCCCLLSVACCCWSLAYCRLPVGARCWLHVAYRLVMAWPGAEGRAWPSAGVGEGWTVFVSTCMWCVCRHDGHAYMHVCNAMRVQIHLMVWFWQLALGEGHVNMCVFVDVCVCVCVCACVRVSTLQGTRRVAEQTCKSDHA